MNYPFSSSVSRQFFLFFFGQNVSFDQKGCRALLLTDVILVQLSAAVALFSINFTCCEEEATSAVDVCEQLHTVCSPADRPHHRAACLKLCLMIRSHGGVLNSS